MARNVWKTLRVLAPLLAELVHCQAGAQMPRAPAEPLQLRVEPAQKTSAAELAPMLGVTWAGKRIVAVGDLGIVLLSDDGGQHFRQAADVPVSSTLTAVSFIDDTNGWAVGHWGVILHTEDGGEHWAIQRTDTSEDRPLFSVYFLDANEGLAVGLWSLVLKTRDGGKTWSPLVLPPPPDGGKADRNLFKIFAHGGSLFVAAERGATLRSDDRGQTWRYLNTGYKGSFWSGVALSDGTLLVAGLRGSLYRSTDGGKKWIAVPTGTKSSITDLIETGGKIIGVGLDGVQLESIDGGATFAVEQRSDRVSLTAVIAQDPQSPILFSRRGPLVKH